MLNFHKKKEKKNNKFFVSFFFPILSIAGVLCICLFIVNFQNTKLNTNLLNIYPNQKLVVNFKAYNSSIVRRREKHVRDPNSWLTECFPNSLFNVNDERE